MDPEIVKTATELAKATGTAAGLSIPFTGIVKRMLGPAADELAEMWRDQVRLYRYERQLKCVQKAEKMAQEAGFVPQAVPPKLLFPLLEGASMEDDENLHDMWAALLANAASPDYRGKVRPAFIAVLKQMAPDEAVLLNRIDESVRSYPLDETELMKAYVALGFGPRDCKPIYEQLSESASFVERFEACRDSLEAAQLIRRSDEPFNEDRKHGLSSFGAAFLKICRPPKPKENG